MEQFDLEVTMLVPNLIFFDANSVFSRGLQECDENTTSCIHCLVRNQQSGSHVL